MVFISLHAVGIGQQAYKGLCRIMHSVDHFGLALYNHTVFFTQSPMLTSEKTMWNLPGRYIVMCTRYFSRQPSHNPLRHPPSRHPIPHKKWSKACLYMV